jgi:hypothetical protein
MTRSAIEPTAEVFTDVDLLLTPTTAPADARIPVRTTRAVRGRRTPPTGGS